MDLTLLAQILTGVLCGAAFFLLAWWLRSRRMEVQHQASLAFYGLSEKIIAAASPAEIAAHLSSTLPGILQATAAQLYLFNRRTRCLELVTTIDSPRPLAALISDPPDGMANAAVTCFQNRGLLSVPDVRRNPLIQVTSLEGLPRSAMFVPLLSLGEPVGVLEVDNAARVGYFAREDQEAVQHLANQVATALRLQQQQTMREQLFRGEKLAATGYLISGVANELREPIENIARLTAAAVPAPPELGDAVRRATEIMARLVSFANSENATPEEVDVAALLAGLARFREPQWQANELRVQNRAAHGPALVLGVESQLEQVFLSLLVHAEQRAALSPVRTVTLQTSVLAGRVLVEIGHSAGPSVDSADPEPADPPEQAIDLEVCTGIVSNHGGEIHILRQPGLFGFEVDLPSAKITTQAETIRTPLTATRPLTLILVDPDRTAAHQLMALLSRRGHRVVPARAEEAADLAQRLRFDAALWSSGPGRGEWTQFRDRVRASIGAFILISDGYDRQLAESMEQNGSYLLARPVEELALERVLSEIASRGVHAD